MLLCFLQASPTAKEPNLCNRLKLSLSDISSIDCSKKCCDNRFMNSPLKNSGVSTNRRTFLQGTVMAVAGSAATYFIGLNSAQSAEQNPSQSEIAVTDKVPCGTLGKAKISRLMIGGNLVSGYMHARDLKYVGALFRAYVTEEKLMQTFALAEKYGINTVFETGGEYVQKYNSKHNGRMQFIPHIKVEDGQSEQALREHIKRQADTGAVALYVWGVAGDKLVQAGKIELLRKAVEIAKNITNLPIGVGGHSLLVPMNCEKHNVPCDFYVKTLHRDDYPSATLKSLRKEFIWLDGGEGWYDNMWCINPEETIQFMKTVKKPWIAFKVLAAGAIYPRDGFPYAFASGADFIAVGMFDFQIKDNAILAAKVVRQTQKRERPWYS